jgi:hypothetical protein
MFRCYFAFNLITTLSLLLWLAYHLLPTLAEYQLSVLNLAPTVA